MMKDLSDWVRECWISWSRPPILAMKVCLPGHVTAMPSISFRNLQCHSTVVYSVQCTVQCHNVSSDKSAVSTIVMVPQNHIVISKDQRVGDKFKSRQTWLDQWPNISGTRKSRSIINSSCKRQQNDLRTPSLTLPGSWPSLAPLPPPPSCTVLRRANHDTQHHTN